MVLFVFEGGVYIVVIVKDFCFWSFGGFFFLVFFRDLFCWVLFNGVLCVVICNILVVIVVCLFIGFGGVDMVFIFGFENVIVGLF